MEVISNVAIAGVRKFDSYTCVIQAYSSCPGLWNTRILNLASFYWKQTISCYRSQASFI